MRGLGRGQGLVTSQHPNSWNLPWGVVGRAQGTATQSAVTTAQTDVTGLTATFTAVANRVYKVEYKVGSNSNAGASNSADFSLLVDGVQVDRVSIFHSTTTGHSTGVYYTTLSAASHTIKVQAAATAAGTCNVVGTATAPHTLIVTDVGAA